MAVERTHSCKLCHMKTSSTLHSVFTIARDSMFNGLFKNTFNSAFCSMFHTTFSSMFHSSQQKRVPCKLSLPGRKKLESCCQHKIQMYKTVLTEKCGIESWAVARWCENVPDGMEVREALHACFLHKKTKIGHFFGMFCIWSRIVTPASNMQV